MFRSVTSRVAVSFVLALFIWTGALLSLACGAPSKATIQKLYNGALVVAAEIDVNGSLPDQLLAEKIINAEQYVFVQKYIAQARGGAIALRDGLATALIVEKPSLKTLAPIVASIILNLRGLTSLVNNEKVQRFFAAVEIGLRVLGSYFALQISDARKHGRSDREILAETGFRDTQNNLSRLSLLATAYDGNRFDEYAAALR